MLNPHVGGPNAISWPAFWAVLGASVLISLPDRFTTWSAATAWRNLLCITIAVGLMFAVMWVLGKVLLRNAAAHPRPWRAVGIFVIGAVVRALALAALLPTIGVGESRPLFRVISSVLVMVPVLMITASVVDLVRTSAARRAALQAEAEVLLSAERSAMAKTAELQQGAMAHVRALLLERLDAVRGRDAAGVSDDLRRDAEQVIRPMSHRMAIGAPVAGTVASPQERGMISWGEVWRSASLGRPFRPMPIALVALIGSANALAGSTGAPVRGLGYALALWVLVLAIFTLLDRLLTPLMRRMHTGVRTAVLIVASTGGLMVAGLSLGWLITATGGLFAWRIPIALMTLGPFVAWALAIDQGFRQQVAAADADLAAANARLEVAAALAASVLWHEERRLSRALHGPVQAAVIAAAMRMEAGDEAGAEGLLEGALGHLDLDAQEQRRVSEALGELAAAWDGLCAVRAELGPGVEGDLDASPPVSAAFIDICTEACSNAVRHAGARHVTVQAECDGEVVTLMVSDDGTPDGAESSGGLGTALLDDVTLAWGRQREGDRTVLRASLPVAA